MSYSYLRSWLPGLTSAPPAGPQSEVTFNVMPPNEEEEAEDVDDDVPPAFPSLSSAQRLSSSTTPRAPGTSLGANLDILRMPPPPLPSPNLAVRTPGVPNPAPTFLASNSNSLAVPFTTTKPPTNLKSKKREKVALAPGFGPLDWAALKSSGRNLRGVDTLLRVPPSVLKLHNKKDDAWTSINGKVYNITPYLPFHPGGEKELMRVAGRDGTKLFALTHAWVNADFMLDECLVGFLAQELPSS